MSSAYDALGVHDSAFAHTGCFAAKFSSVVIGIARLKDFGLRRVVWQSYHSSESFREHLMLEDMCMEGRRKCFVHK